MDVKFIDNSEEIKDNMKNVLLRALEKVGMTAEKYAKRLCCARDGCARRPDGAVAVHGGDTTLQIICHSFDASAL